MFPTDKKMKLITILIPAYNEEANLPRLKEHLDMLAADRFPKQKTARPGLRSEDVPSMTDYEWEFLFVDDGTRGFR